MLRPTAIDHVGLVVKDMDQTLQFYQRLGLTLLRSSGPNAEGVRTAVIRVGSQELNVFSSPASGAGGPAPAIGMDHFCLAVDAASIEEVVADLKQVGITVERGPIKRRDGMALFVHDPDGVRVELQLKNAATL
jgi:catechol 2,3-dioxygenase-like lactoylglutathione lyase family enzyme